MLQTNIYDFIGTPQQANEQRVFNKVQDSQDYKAANLIIEVLKTNSNIKDLVCQQIQLKGL